MSDDAIAMFGEPVPGEAVDIKIHDPLKGYSPRGRYEQTRIGWKRHETPDIQVPCTGCGRPVDLTAQRRRDSNYVCDICSSSTKGSPMAPTATAEALPTVVQAPNPMTVYECIVAVSAELGQQGISKNRNNQQQNYKFRGIDDVLNALSSVLAKYRLVILPRVMSRSVAERETRNGGALFYVTVEVEFDFVSANDGSTHTVKTFGEAMDSADKATNKAMSAAYKYAAIQTFCIPTEGDNDADAVTHDVKAPSRPQPVAPPVRPAAAVATRGSDEGPDLGTLDDSRDLPEGFHLIDNYHLDGDWHQVSWGRDAQGGSAVYKTKIAKIGIEAAVAFKKREPVHLVITKFPYIDKVEPLGMTREQLDSTKWRHEDEDQRR